jgi:hypothetical protein
MGTFRLGQLSASRPTGAILTVVDGTTAEAIVIV